MAEKEIKNISKNKIIAIIAAILAVIYIGLSVFFTNHFYFGTKINGENCSGKTVEEVEDIFGKISNDYKLTMVDKRDNEFTITAKDIDFKFHDIDQIQKIKDSQSAFGWIVGIFQNKDYNADIVSYNEAKLQEKYNGFKLFDKDYVIEPKSAYPEYSRKTNSYEIRPEIYGNKVKKEELYKEVKKSIISGNQEIKVEEFYEQPKNKEDNEKLAKAVEELNKKVKMKVTYDFEDRKEVFSGYEIAQLLNCDSEGNYNITINRDRMIELLRGLSKQYSTYGDPRPFKASSGKEITIYGGSYGWLIDKEKEADELTKVIESGKSVTREPIYSQKALYRTKDDIGKTYVEISLGGQYLWYYRDGKLITSFPVVTGNTSKGHGTPGGIYPLNYKTRDTYLTGRNYRSHVNYWMPFNGNIGLHDATWRGSFGGGIYRSSGSHGCVNCPLGGAATVYKTIEPGTPIILY